MYDHKKQQILAFEKIDFFFLKMDTNYYLSIKIFAE